ncbi:MAG: tyrosine-type recombinase/integrase, partial [Desulfomonilia bacterium]|nr:tyrosine-type recombinase/integrase [Desulfomonilia bacterium]
MSLETFFGWCIAVFVVLCLLNFVLKQISRDYIKKLSSSRQDFANAYRSFMRVVVKNHRVFGFVALILLAVHFIAVYLSEILSLTGVISGAALIATPGQLTRRGVRDTALILLTFDAAARIQEVLDLAVGDIDTTPGRGTVTVTGKGQKIRVVPIMDKTGRHLDQYIGLFHPGRPDPGALLFYT